MNKIILVGNLTRDPEIRVIEESGKALTKITIAVQRPFRNTNGEKEADFIQVVFFDKRAETVAEFFKKGDPISVSGRLQTRNYEDKDGKRRYITEVVADDFQFIHSRRSNENIG
jgi:single-strand DNA-binding protein